MLHTTKPPALPYYIQADGRFLLMVVFAFKFRV